MRSGLLLFFCACLLWPPVANAGAWLREKGTSFTSISFSTTWFRDTANASYLEYGVRDDLTIGADIGYASSNNGTQSGYGVIFVRRPLWQNDGPNQWAYELGVGAAWVDDYVLPVVKTGISWGRGIKVRDKYGWMAVDTSIAWDVADGHHLAKIDTTVGINFTEVTTGMVQLFIANLDRDTYASIAPSIVLKPRKSKFQYQIGLETQLGNADFTGIKIGLWREF
jgi:hypothetical protein